ncbi:ABC transporter permease [Runella sp.]|uniref:ABC transporter permease n=1 Tax=Runella sp. TaxID=1960881 RepID=UPI003D128A33
MNFIYSFQSEWLKTKRSLASWLVIVGGFFIPLIMVAARMLYPDRAQKEGLSPRFWENLMTQHWQLMALFLLPMGVILATSLITQLEFKNNTWKQLHTTPQGLSTIFWSKLSVILLMMFQFFVLFNVGIFLSGITPALILGTVDYPKEVFPMLLYLKSSGYFFVDCLPIVALQYLVSLQFRNFLVSFGVGIGVLLAALFAVEWEYGYIIPYTYCPYNFFFLRGANMKATQHLNIHALALGYFTVFTLISYILYLTKKEKG